MGKSKRKTGLWLQRRGGWGSVSLETAAAGALLLARFWARGGGASQGLGHRLGPTAPPRCGAGAARGGGQPAGPQGCSRHAFRRGRGRGNEGAGRAGPAVLARRRPFRRRRPALPPGTMVRRGRGHRRCGLCVRCPARNPLGCSSAEVAYGYGRRGSGPGSLPLGSPGKRCGPAPCGLLRQAGVPLTSSRAGARLWQGAVWPAVFHIQECVSLVCLNAKCSSYKYY